MWTRHLAGCAATVTAIDAAPEMIALARQQVTAGNVTFVTADILTWAPRWWVLPASWSSRLICSMVAVICSPAVEGLACYVQLSSLPQPATGKAKGPGP
jgi:hypothetical protein